MLKKSLILAVGFIAAVGCGTESATEQNSELEVIGVWANEWGTDIVTATNWNQSAIVEFDNDTNTLITQAPKDDEYNPEKFSRIAWTDVVDGMFHYCTVAFGKDSATEAANSEEKADANDLTGIGCGGFPWTKAVVAIEVHGSWVTEWGSEEVTSHMWNAMAVVSYDNELNLAITQNPEDDEYSPNTFSKVVWTDISTDGFLHYCTVAFGHETAADALAAEDSSNIEDLDGEGCGGFKWTKLNPAE